MGRVAGLTLLLAAGIAETGCAWLFCPDECDSSPTPVQGTASMFTLIGSDGEGYRVGDLVQCGSGPEHFTTVTGTGSRYAGMPSDGGCRSVPPVDAGSDCSVTLDSLQAAIYTELRERGVGVSTGFGSVCAEADALGVFVGIYDYAKADAATQAIGEALGEHELGDTVYLRIGPEPHACAQSGCGW